MLDLEWRLAGLRNVVDPLATLDCHWFLLLLKSFKNFKKHLRNTRGWNWQNIKKHPG